MKILYPEECSWELDYIKNIASYDFDNNLEIEKYNTNNCGLLLGREDIVSNCLIVMTVQFYDIKNIEEIIKKVQPLVILCLSDEYGKFEKHNDLEKYTKLFLRQYNHKNYNYSSHNIQIPLGYVTNFLPSNSNIVITDKCILNPMNKRKINCSFIGTRKSDRQHMCSVFEKNMDNTIIVFVNNNWNIENLPITPNKLFTLYNNSIFTIIGRGNVSLDCFRIYEAVVAGSIPVIVGEKSEIDTTFFYGGNIPPFVYSDTWENAVSFCNNLLVEPELLQEKQDKILEWWNNQITDIKKIIYQTIHQQNFHS
jgi:hypothetical protein